MGETRFPDNEKENLKVQKALWKNSEGTTKMSLSIRQPHVGITTRSTRCFDINVEDTEAIQLLITMCPSVLPHRKRSRVEAGLCKVDLEEESLDPKPVMTQDERKEYLKDWLSAHKDYPFPTEAEKKVMMADTGMDLTQITNNLGNGRRRILKYCGKGFVRTGLRKVKQRK